MTNSTVSTQTLTSSLERARALALPSREAMLARAPSVQMFWDDNRELFAKAWHEWEQTEQALQPLNDALLDSKLQAAVEQAWQNPITESQVKEFMARSGAGRLYRTVFQSGKTFGLT